MRYEIIGDNLPAVICTLDAGETIVSESGAMSWMSPNMQMETQGGGLKKVFGRAFSGESLFQNRYTSVNGEGMIAFASSFPGDIIPLEIEPGKEFIVQKKGFLASTTGVNLDVRIQKKFGIGLFGGEGFVMQRLSGQGLAFIEVDGSTVEYNLAAGQSIVADTGYVAYMDGTCSMDIQQIPGLKNVLFGGEGLFNTVVTGPGRVVLQTMPLYKLAGVLKPFFPAPDNNK